MTPEEFDAVTDYDDRYRYELVHEVLIVSPFADPGESRPNDFLGYLLYLYASTTEPRPAIDATLPEHPIQLVDSRRCADRVIWAGLGREPDFETDVPTVAIEFVSKSNRDRVRDYEEKRREYLAAGIKEYWVVDRFARTMTVFRQAPDLPAEHVVPADGVYRTPFLPGFELALASLLAFSKSGQAKRRKPR